MKAEDFRAVFDASPNAYMLLDRDLRFVAANPAYLRVTHSRLEDLLGRPILEVFPHDPSDPDNQNARLLRESLLRAIESRSPDVLAFIPYKVPRDINRRVALEERLWSATHTPILDEHGEVRYVLQHTVDVTELSQLQRGMTAGVLQRAQLVQETNYNLEAERQQLEHARDQLQEQALFEQQLIGIVSHDLRNPINAIGIAAALLKKRGELDEHQKRVVARIESSAERARRLIRDFLDFTEARSRGRIPIAPVPANVREIARQVFDEVQLMHPHRHATLEHEGEETGTWDADRIAQVIGNLLSNAFQHGTSDGPVRLRTRGDSHDVLIEVHNQGPPIAPDDLARLFRPFERGIDRGPSSERSVGLGLYISKQIVDAHGGTISVRSTHDEGTVFMVRLPRTSGAGVDAREPRCADPADRTGTSR